MFNGGNDRHFTDYMADSTWTRFLVDGDEASTTTHLDAMIALYDKWDDHFDTASSSSARNSTATFTEPGVTGAHRGSHIPQS